MKSHHLFASAIVTASLFWGAAAEAQVDDRQLPGYQPETFDEDNDDGDWNVIAGLGLGYGTLSEGSSDGEFIALPILSVGYKDRIFFGFDGISAVVRETDNFALDVSLSPIFPRDDDENEFRGLGEVDAGASIGFDLNYVLFDAVELGAGISQEIGASEGLSASFSAATGLEVGQNGFFGVSVGTTWGSEDFNQVYYGVTAKQAADRDAFILANPTSTIRPYTAYSPGSGFQSVDFGASYGIDLGEKWGMSFDASYSLFLDKAKDSPFVTEDGQAEIGFAIFRYF